MDCSSFLQSSPERRSLFPSPLYSLLHIPNPIRHKQTELRRRESLRFENLQRNLRSAFQFGRESDRRRCLGRCRGRNRRLTGAGIRRLRSGIVIAEEAEEIVADLRIRILIADRLRCRRFVCMRESDTGMSRACYIVKLVFQQAGRKSPLSPRRGKSHSRTPRRRRSRSSTPRRYRRQRSRSSTKSPIHKSGSPSLSTDNKNAIERLRKEEEEKKRLHEIHRLF
ncbi:hypothetical protein MRB53_022088 [Persea americana]|uniref:Uncharacterized protein n=1 Tax=Persea americana TaxID=3435 RepID=A0ACC2L5Z4_PERAE|nr:hypothetical protein MRB53_022088 [Persea americana]